MSGRLLRFDLLYPVYGFFASLRMTAKRKRVILSEAKDLYD